VDPLDASRREIAQLRRDVERSEAERARLDRERTRLERKNTRLKDEPAAARWPRASSAGAAGVVDSAPGFRRSLDQNVVVRCSICAHMFECCCDIVRPEVDECQAE
jgi:hypothetical protein